MFSFLLALGVTIACAKKKKSNSEPPKRVMNMEETVVGYCVNVPDSEFQLNDVSTGVDKSKTFAVSFRGEISKMNNAFDNSSPFTKMFVRDLAPPSMKFEEIIGNAFFFFTAVPRAKAKVYVGVDEFQVRTKFQTTSNGFEVSLLKKKLVYDDHKNVTILDSADDFHCHANNQNREMCHKVIEYKISQLEVALKNPKNKDLDKLFDLKMNCANEILKYLQDNVLVPKKETP